MSGEEFMSARDLDPGIGSSCGEKPGPSPTPWVADVDYVHGPVVTAANGDLVGDFTMWEGEESEAAANARLISAAPDYDAAARLIDAAFGDAPDEVIAGAFGDDMLAALKATRAAISKASPTGGEGS